MQYNQLNSVAFSSSSYPCSTFSLPSLTRFLFFLSLSRLLHPEVEIMTVSIFTIFRSIYRLCLSSFSPSTPLFSLSNILLPLLHRSHYRSFCVWWAMFISTPLFSIRGISGINILQPPAFLNAFFYFFGLYLPPTQFSGVLLANQAIMVGRYSVRMTLKRTVTNYRINLPSAELFLSSSFFRCV